MTPEGAKVNMPEVISVAEFVAETNEDYQAPTTSSFSTRMSHCRNAVAALEEVRPRTMATGIDTSQEEVVAGRTVLATTTKKTSVKQFELRNKSKRVLSERGTRTELPHPGTAELSTQQSVGGARPSSCRGGQTDWWKTIAIISRYLVGHLEENKSRNQIGVFETPQYLAIRTTQNLQKLPRTFRNQQGIYLFLGKTLNTLETWGETAIL